MRAAAIPSLRENPIDAKIMQFEEAVVLWPLFSRILDKIRECHYRSRVSSEPRCLLITGETGYGKSTLAEYYTKQHKRLTTDNGSVITVLCTCIPSSATVKGFASRILEDLGDPFHYRGTTHALTSRLCKLLIECQVELIIMDEFQHLINSDSDIVLSNTADWLKDILNRTRIPIILFGLPVSTKILHSNSQLMRRFSTTINLQPFYWIPQEQRENFLKFLAVLEKAIPDLKPSHLYREENALPIFCATRGIPSMIKKLVSRAAQYAYENELTEITKDALAFAYDEELANNSSHASNPFSLDTSELSSLDLNNAGWGNRKERIRTSDEINHANVGEILRR